MLNSILQFLDNYLAETVYEYNAGIVFIIGIVISVLPWGITLQKLKKSAKAAIMISIILVTSSLSAYIQYVNNTYGVLPNYTLNSSSYRQLETLLNEAGFMNIRCEYDDMAANILRQNESLDLYGYDFKVTQMTPESGSFEELDINVTLNITWERNINSTSVAPSENNSEADASPTLFDARSFYGKVDEMDLSPFNTDELTLFTSELALKMITEKKDTYHLGTFQKTTIPIRVQLINYPSNEIVSTQNAFLGDDVYFADIPSGIYYYTIQADGYEICVPTSLFCLKYDGSPNKDILQWTVALDKIGIPYSSAFKILLLNEQGKSISHTEARLRVVSHNYPSPLYYSSYLVTSDANGFLTLRRTINDVEYYDLVEFLLRDDHHLEICLAEHNEFIYVHIADDLGTCLIPN